MQKADHSGHRNRLRAKYTENGIEALAPHEVLELLLFYAVPYRNTNDIAKNLLDRFDSLSAVLDASVELLTEAGLTVNQATFLKLIPDVTRLYLLDKHEDNSKILDLSAIGDMLINRFVGMEQEEHVHLILVDKKMKVVYSGELSKGTFNASELSIRRILNLALNYGAVGAIMAHNHPSGFSMPSQQDVRATDQIRSALSVIGVRLIDHFIIADRECLSMRDSGLFD